VRATIPRDTHRPIVPGRETTVEQVDGPLLVMGSGGLVTPASCIWTPLVSHALQRLVTPG
jgi:hypothetical protein